MSDPGIIEKYLSTIVEQLGAMCLDMEVTVRNAFVKLFRAVLSSCNVTFLEPYRAILCAHLCCAMTHINGAVREDSLVLLDVYLECCPQVLVISDTHVLACFVSQISTESIDDKGQETKKRTLLVNADGSSSSQKWRINVLQRLKRFLIALCSVVSLFIFCYFKLSTV